MFARQFQSTLAPGMTPSTPRQEDGVGMRMNLIDVKTVKGHFSLQLVPDATLVLSQGQCSSRAARSPPRPPLPRPDSLQGRRIALEAPPPCFRTGLITPEHRGLQLSGFNKNRSGPRLASFPPGNRSRPDGPRTASSGRAKSGAPWLTVAT